MWGIKLIIVSNKFKLIAYSMSSSSIDSQAKRKNMVRGTCGAKAPIWIISKF